jgi:hypothetical protein
VPQLVLKQSLLDTVLSRVPAVCYFARLHFRRAPVFRHSSKNKQAQLRALVNRDVTSRAGLLSTADKEQYTLSGFGDASLNASSRTLTRNNHIRGMWLLALNYVSSGGNLHSFFIARQNRRNQAMKSKIKLSAVVNSVSRLHTEFPSQT